MKTLAAFLLISSALVGPAAAAEETFAMAPFGTVHLYHATAAPAHVVLFASGDGGWKLGVVDMARELESMGALVVGFDLTRYVKTVVDAAHAAPGACFDPAGDFEKLARAAEERLAYAGYVPPILAGYSSGATLVYAALVQARPHSFAGALSLGFCPDLIVNMPICPGNGLAWQRDPQHSKGIDFLPSRGLEDPWIALQGDIDKICVPAATRAYVAQVPRGELVWLHKVGHGFSAPKRWMRQFKDAFARLAHLGG